MRGIGMIGRSSMMMMAAAAASIGMNASRASEHMLMDNAINRRPVAKRSSRAPKTIKRRNDEREGKSFKLKGIRC